MAQIHPQKVAIVLNDQAWTYGELIEQVERAACHLHGLNITHGQIIYQFVERSFEMVCGLLSIMSIGGVYCPLNPMDPPTRLASIFEHIQGQYVLLHQKTYHHFPSIAVHKLIILEEILSSLSGAQDMKELPYCSESGAAYIVCTSGTTGRPKAIVHTHKSFAASNAAYIQWDANMYTVRDQVLQLANCSWILHLSEIALPLVVGGTIVLLQPNGHLDMTYFSQTLLYQQVTTIIIGPATIRALISFLTISERFDTFKFVHNLCVTGIYKLFDRMWNYLRSLLVLK